MERQFLKYHLVSRVGVNADESVKIFKNPYVAFNIHYKSYPRFKHIYLNDTLNNSELEKFLTQRKTRRKFSGRPISLGEISHLLYYSCGLSDRHNERRMYPSAGARYPIETYICVKNALGVIPGLYHYNVKENTIEFLLEDKKLTALKKCLVKNILPKNTVAVIILAAMFNRNYTKYTERSYRYSLIECGHIGQNISLLSEKLGLGCCAIGGFIDDKINAYLDIEPSTEAVLYVFALGKK
jgi:SagB-type dehydrogenase family enzyme